MHRIFLPAAVVFALVGCGEEMGPLEAANALGQAARSSEGTNATQEPIEVSTDFTIGAALEDAAAELQAFWDSQAGCNEVTRDGATTTIDWGELGDGCVYDGHTYAGLTAITVQRTDAEDLEVLHEWMGFHNEDVQVDGEALVTWSAQARTRHVTTEHTWTTTDGETADVQGDHEFGVREAGGFSLDGVRDWQTDRGDWHLDMVDIGFRLQDPLPEEGSYIVTNPAGKVLTLAFSRFDDQTIEAVLTGVRGGDLVYHVGRFGDLERVE
ncbi:MAG: hypothetical protein H6737_24650 [Alphaproteobacteria bacterium]|nr:hypothetical protein [Alphaproteobacteria bacterium]